MAELRQIFVNNQTVAREWHYLLVATRLGPKTLLDQFGLLIAALRPLPLKPPPKPEQRDFSGFTDQELNGMITRYKKRHSLSDRQLEARIARQRKRR